ncbi:MAG: L-threonylcarbamoyladenylate synthase [Actinobacteria bacterium]|nr:L-threonylcarbamoyladenylate synthase [Actinomycetota bacterium]
MTRIIFLEKLEKQEILEIVEILRNGGIALIPTETVYGLFCVYNNKQAVERIFEIKKRPKEKILTLTLADVEQSEDFVFLENWQKSTMKRFLPGPVTFVLKTKANLLPELISEEGKTGIRIPDLELIQELIQYLRMPLASTSANLSGHPSPAKFSDVSQEILHSVDVAVDGGECSEKIPSTVYDLSFFPGRLIRKGKIEEEEIVKVAGDYYRNV